MKATYFKKALIVALLFGFHNINAAPTVTRDKVLADIRSGLTPEAISKKYNGYIADDYDVTMTPYDDGGLPLLPNSIIPWLISTRYEALSGCGYHPQRKEFACRVDIKQPTGYAGVLIGSTGTGGSLEYVTVCVDFSGSGTFVPINTNGFHVNDANTLALSGNPVWNFAAIIPANLYLFQKLLNREAFRAKAILSWGFPITSCNANPIWGSISNFRIRLDP